MEMDVDEEVGQDFVTRIKKKIMYDKVDNLYMPVRLSQKEKEMKEKNKKEISVEDFMESESDDDEN